MDNFRWILLAVGIVIIVIIYLISRKNKREFYREDDDISGDLPEINTRHLDDLDEGVGEVRIIARNDDISLYTDESSVAERRDVKSEAEPESDLEVAADTVNAAVDDVQVSGLDVAEPVAGTAPEIKVEAAASTPEEVEQEAEAELAETVLILNIMARDGSTLSGDSINSVALASKMIFGEMNIYHLMDDQNQPVFSMINMVKPGSFDPATIHELATPGVSLFMQLPGPANASKAFDDMLQTAYRMSETLEARLCDRRRQPLTETVVETYRNTAASFDGKAG
jgi:cell division protein ZipA